MTSTQQSTQVIKLSSDANFGITCHAWNHDGTRVAICPNSNELHIYDRTPEGAWKLNAKLAEHDMIISAVDWCHGTNSIVTCSHDRNAFVWTETPQEDGSLLWKPALVILRIDKSATDVKWSPNGLKFAAASAAKCVSVCSFESSENWWVSKTIKKHKSTVLCLAWHPNSEFIATGSTDFKCRVFSAYMNDGAAGPDPAEQANFLGQSLPFAEMYCDFPAAGSSPCGWVNSVAWSPTGNTLAFAAHDATVHVVSFEGQAVEQVIHLSTLPINVLCFCSDTGFIGAGHDFSPMAFGHTSTQWSLLGALESKETAKSKETAAPTSQAAMARAKFAAMTSKGTSNTSSAIKSESYAWKQHHSAVTCMRPYGAHIASPAFPSITTSAMDGRIVVWDLKTSPVPASAIGVE